MNNYELLFILSPSISEEEREALINKFKGQIENGGGTIASVEKWGLKKLAYEIKFKTEGFYVLINFSSSPEISQAVEKLMLITENILRCMVIRK